MKILYRLKHLVHTIIRNQREHSEAQNEKIKIYLLKTIPFWIASFTTGLVVVGYSKLFRFSEELGGFLRFKLDWSIFILTPACFLFAWYIVKRYASFASGSGIPQVMLAIDLESEKHEGKVSKLLSLRIIIVKICSSLCMALGGAVIGSEGPTIQISASIFKSLNGMLPSWWPKISRKNMLITGAAAGLAAAFNTPLGGIVFVMEELTQTHISYFRTAILAAVIIAGLTAQAIVGSYLFIGYVNTSPGESFSIFLAIILVAILAGLGGAYLGKVILLIGKWRASFKTRGIILFIIVCGLSIASIAYFWDYRILGSGKEHMTNLLFSKNKYDDWYLPLIRFYGSMISFVLGGAGGVFAPGLSLGANIGSIVSSLFEFNDASSNILILVGMVGFLTGLTRTPFTSSILVLEMTDRHTVIFPLLISSMVAGIFAYAVQKHSFYHHLKNQYAEQIN